MQMQNTRISITPLFLSYNTKKPFSILLKIKRILISTNYELQKWECKKQFLIKDNYVDLAAYAHLTTFSFKLSKQLQLGNTKIDLIVFGFLNKDVNLLGICTLDLGKFQHQNFSKDPFYQQMKIALDKSQDSNAYLKFGIFIQQLPRNQIISHNKIPKAQSNDINSLKTQSYNKQSIIIGRRKKPQMPTVYQISRQNYKQVQVTRNIEERSRSKSRNNSGSYKKRFQYQYSRQMTARDRNMDEDEQPQQPPQAQVARKQRSSPMPRMKTPQPIIDYRSSVQSAKLIPKPRVQSVPISNNHHYSSLHNNKMFDQTINFSYSQRYENNKYQQGNRNRHKIIIDVQRSKIPPNFNKSFESQQSVSQQNYNANNIEKFEKQNINKWQTNKFKRQKELVKANLGRIQPNIRKNEAVSPSSSAKKQNKFNNQNFTQFNQQTLKEQQNHIPKLHIDNTNQNSIQSQQQNKNIQNFKKDRQSNHQVNRSNDGDYFKHVTSIEIMNNSVKRSKKQLQQKSSLQQQKQPPSKFSKKVSQEEPKSSKQIKKQDKFKQITQKLQLIEDKINQGKKSPSVGKKSVNESYSRYKTNGENKMQNQSPKKQQNGGRVKDAEKTKLQSSTNTFKEQHFESQAESSPGNQPFKNKHQTSDGKYIKSFNHQGPSYMESIHQKQKQEEHEKSIKLTGRFKGGENSQKPQQNQFDNENKSNRKQNFVASLSKIPISQSKHQQSIDTFGKNSQNLFQSQVNHFQLQKQQANQRKKQSMKKQSGKQIPNLIANTNKKVKVENDQSQTEQINKVVANKEIQTNIIQKQIKKQYHNQINKTLQVKILPSIIEKVPPSPQNLTKSADITASDQTKKLKQKYEQKITNLQNMMDQQQQNYRKKTMQKELQFKNLLKQQQKKYKQEGQKQIERLNIENNKLKQKQIISSKQLKQSDANKNRQLQRLKEQYINIKKLNDKLNIQLQESDTKHFQLLTAAQKKDMQYQRKLQQLSDINNELSEELKNKQNLLNQYKNKIKKYELSATPQTQSQQVIKTTSINSLQSEKNMSEGQASVQQQNAAMKQQILKLQGHVRKTENDLRFANIKIQNLLQEKKDLQNQIDNIAANNKHEMARTGSINKINLQSASISNNIKMENKILKQEIGNLQKQVHELNGLLQGIINEGAVSSERMSSNKQNLNRQNYESLYKKYKALQKINQSHQQQIKSKQMKIAEIINLIFSQNNQKLMDEVEKII